MDKSNSHDSYANDRYAKMRLRKTHAKVSSRGDSVIVLETVLE
jgi:hypothetical protein